jgi:methyl-accepting chemotaxis protein
MGNSANVNQEVTLGKWTLKKKLILVMILSGLLPFLVFFFMSLKSSKQEILTLNENRLISIREAKKLQIENYFKTIHEQIVNLSSNLMIVDAMKEFKPAFFNAETEVADTFGSTEETKLRGRYTYQAQNTPGVSSDAVSRWMPQKTISKIMQSLYISANSHPIGEKEKLDVASDSSTYSKLHQKYHPTIRKFLSSFGYYDIFLVEPDTGHIVYSVFKEVDYATSLLTGPYANTGIGRAFKGALNLDDPDGVFIDDFKPYEPSYNAAASFISSPIFDGNEKIGVLIFQAPVDEINSVMTSNNKWKDVGLGDSGEVYLVGQDKLLRNNSRFIIEAPEAYFKFIEKLGVDSKIIQRQKDLNSTIGIAEVNTPGTNEALKGNSGFSIFPDYRNVSVLSAYAPVDIIGLKWGILAEIDEVEALQSYEDLKASSINIGMILMLVIGVAGYFISIRAMAPIERVTQIAQEIAKGNLNQKNFEIRSRDEIGLLRQAFNKMLQNLNLFVDQAQTMEQGKLNTKEVVERLKKGMTFDEAAGFVEAKYQVTHGELADAFDSLTSVLRKTTLQAVRIANDQLDASNLKEEIPGELGDAFQEMIKKMKWFSEQANFIANNDLYNENLSDEGTGTLGSAISTMVKNLRAPLKMMM